MCPRSMYTQCYHVLGSSSSSFLVNEGGHFACFLAGIQNCNGLSELATPHFSIPLSRTFSNSLDNTGNREIAL